MSNRNKETILILEDEAIIAMDIIYQLKTMGLTRTVHAATADQAEDAAKRSDIGLILADIMLGDGRDGIQAVGAIRKDGRPPVIFITSNIDSDTRNRAMLLDPVDYLVKPLTPQTLEKALDTAFPDLVSGIDHISGNQFQP